MENYAELSVNEQGEFCVLINQISYPVHPTLFCTTKYIQIGEQTLLYYIGHKFTYDQNYFYYYEEPTLNQIYSENNCGTMDRVPIGKTGFKNTSIPENFFISNRNYTSKVYALTLGLCEAALRSSYPSDLVNMVKVLASQLIKGKKSSHFKNIFESFKDSKSLRETFKDLIQYDINNSQNLQEFCNNYSVGVKLYSFNSTSQLIKDFRLPENPKICPVPLIKLLCYSNLYFLLYDPQENQIDGYNENGILENSYLFEEVPSSFYSFKSETIHEDVASEAIKMLRLYLDSQSNNKSSVEKINNKLLENLLGKSDNLSKIDKDKVQIYIDELKVIQNKIKAINNYNSHPVAPKIGNVSKTQAQIPNNYNGTNFITNISDKPTNTTPPIAIQDYPQPNNIFVQNPTTWNQNAYKAPPQIGNHLNNLPNSNQEFIKPKTEYIDDSAKNVNKMYTSITLNSRNYKKKCPACGEMKELLSFHDTCQLCMFCIAYSIKNKQCVNCDTKDLRLQIQKYTQTGFKCNGCGLPMKDYDLNSKCKCIICRNCKSNLKFDNHGFHNR